MSDRCPLGYLFIDQTTGSHHDLKWVNETGSLHFIRCFGCKYCENNEFQIFFKVQRSLQLLRIIYLKSLREGIFWTEFHFDLLIIQRFVNWRVQVRLANYFIAYVVQWKLITKSSDTSGNKIFRVSRFVSYKKQIRTVMQTAWSAMLDQWHRKNAWWEWEKSTTMDSKRLNNLMWKSDNEDLAIGISGGKIY